MKCRVARTHAENATQRLGVRGTARLSDRRVLINVNVDLCDHHAAPNILMGTIASASRHVITERTTAHHRPVTYDQVSGNRSNLIAAQPETLQSTATTVT